MKSGILFQYQNLLKGEIIRGTFFTILTVAGVIAAMVLLYLKVLPKKLDGTFSSKLLQFLHDYFNFKKLYIESVLKFIFALLTVLCIVGGVVGILSSICGFFVGIVDAMDYGSWYFEVVLKGTGVGILSSLAVTAIGPVLIRLTYEFSMMFVLLVKNVIEINNKTKGETVEQAETPAVEETPVEEQAPVAE